MTDQVVYPIVYVRGFAGGTSGIDSAADDPFYGLNAGATHVRIDGDGNPQFYQFEGPLVRLMEDEDYRVVVHGGQQGYLASVANGTQPQNSIWIYRFYDPAADTFGVPAIPYDLPAAGRGLLSLVDLVRLKTGAPKVWLVAHSMGGLICRSMIQKVCPDAGRDASGIVDKFFTYATPHNGIAFAVAGFNINVPEIAPFGAEIFNREVMYGYLTPGAALTDAPDMPDGWDAHQLTGLDPDRVFCLIGTNAADYGLVSKAVGPKSDGLVQIDNAYVLGASRAFVHRSHSGSYGEVNSEEGYQNLRRFLFGTRKATATLVGIQLPASTQPDVVDVWQAEVRLGIRGLPVLITERTAAHYCPIELGKVPGAATAPGNVPGPDDDAVSMGEPQTSGPAVLVPLAMVFLLDPQRALQMQRDNLEPDTVSSRCRYFLHISVLHLQEKHRLFFWDNHLETMPEWEGTLVVDVGPGDDDPDEHLWAAWQTDNPEVTSAVNPITNEPCDLVPDAGGALSCTVSLPQDGQKLLGSDAAIKISVERLT
jgi:pimeloyl-ACP methyl ester carboxylesterase